MLQKVTVKRLQADTCLTMLILEPWTIQQGGQKAATESHQINVTDRLSRAVTKGSSEGKDGSGFGRDYFFIVLMLAGKTGILAKDGPAKRRSGRITDGRNNGHTGVFERN